MIRTPLSGGHGGRLRRRVLLVAAAVATALAVTGVLSAFHLRPEAIDPEGADAASEVVSDAVVGIRTFIPPSGLDVVQDLEYGVREDGTLLTLDVCRPAADVTDTVTADSADRARLPAVVAVHGGSWARGDKANSDWRRVCLWLASEGFVAASVN